MHYLGYLFIHNTGFYKLLFISCYLLNQYMASCCNQRQMMLLSIQGLQLVIHDLLITINLSSIHPESSCKP